MAKKSKPKKITEKQAREWFEQLTGIQVPKDYKVTCKKTISKQ